MSTTEATPMPPREPDGNDRRSSRSGLLVFLAVSVVAISIGASVVLTQNSDPESRATNMSVDGPGSDPVALIGLWRIGGDSRFAGHIVKMDVQSELEIYGDNCVYLGSWSASASGLLLMNVYSAYPDCSEGWFDDLAAINRVQRFESGGAAPSLLDASGNALLLLAPAGPRESWPSTAQGTSSNGDTGVEAPEQPQPSEVRWLTAPSAPLPPGFVPAVSNLVGQKWYPVDPPIQRMARPEAPYVEFLEGGGWEGTDGCNGVGGTWTGDETTGEILALSGPSTLMGCDNLDVGSVVSQARTVGLADEMLVFFDEKGEEAGRLTSDP